jgi:hypothetical protein
MQNSERPAVEQSQNVEFVGFHDLNGMPGFKLAIQCVKDRWYLYTANLWQPAGQQIIDVTDPANPEVLKYIPGPENTMTVQIQVAEGKMITSEQIIGAGVPPERARTWGFDPDKPYGRGMLIWDVREPAEPKLLGRFDVDGNGTHRNYYAGGNYVHVAANMKGYQGNIYMIVDISDPAHPVEVGRWWYPGQWVEGGEKQEEVMGVPKEILGMHGPATVVGDIVYISYGRSGCVILDISDMTKPKMIGHLSIGSFGTIVGNHTLLPLPERNIAIATTEAARQGGQDPAHVVATVDITDPSNPRFMHIFPTPAPAPGLGYSNFVQKRGNFGPHNLHHPNFNPCHAPVDNILHQAYFNAGLRIWDISDPYLVREAGYFVPENPKIRRGPMPPGNLVTQFDDVLVDTRGYAYVTDKHHGLFVLRYTG